MPRSWTVADFSPETLARNRAQLENAAKILQARGLKVERGQPERALMGRLIQWAKLHNWLVFHDEDSKRNCKGLPDILAVRNGRLIAIETKIHPNVPTPEQLAWLEALNSVPGCGAYLAYPEDEERMRECLR